jgi:hypothetical protein
MVVAYGWGQQNVGFALSIVTASAVSLIARRRGWRLPEPVEWRLGSLTGIRWNRHRKEKP